MYDDEYDQLAASPDVYQNNPPGRGLDPQDEFGQADSLRLAKLRQAASGAQREVDEGFLSPEEGQLLRQKLQEQIAPLQMRQQTAQEKARQQQVQEMMHQSALANGMLGMDQQVRSQGFPSRVANYMDPLSGQSASFYEASPNEWSQIDFGGGSPTEQAGVMAANVLAPGVMSGEKGEAEPGGGAMTGGELPPEPTVTGEVSGKAGVGDNFVAGAGDEIRDKTPEQLPPPSVTGDMSEALALTPPGDWKKEPHTMTIYNGERKEVYQFKPDATSPTGYGNYTKTYDSKAADAKKPGAEVTLSTGELKELHKRANSTLPQVIMTGDHIKDRELMAIRAKEVASLTTHLAEKRLGQKQMENHFRLQSEEHQRQEKARLDREEAKSNAELNTRRRSQVAFDYEKQLESESQKMNQRPQSDWPQWYKDSLTDQDAIHKEAVRRMERHLKGIKDPAAVTPNADKRVPSATEQQQAWAGFRAAQNKNRPARPAPQVATQPEGAATTDIPGYSYPQ